MEKKKKRFKKRYVVIGVIVAAIAAFVLYKINKAELKDDDYYFDLDDDR